MGYDIPGVVILPGTVTQSSEMEPAAWVWVQHERREQLHFLLITMNRKLILAGGQANGRHRPIVATTSKASANDLIRQIVCGLRNPQIKSSTGQCPLDAAL
jgi:hypothetical protein